MSSDVIMIFGLVICFIALFIGLVIPYRIEEVIIGFKNILNMSFEIECTFYRIVSGILVCSAIGIVGVTLNGKA